MNYELDRKTLEERAEEIEKQIDNLYTQRDSICQKLRELDTQQVELTNSILGVEANACIVAIAKTEDYHYNLFDIFYVKEINKTGNRIAVLEYTYRYDDYEYTFHVKETQLGRSVFDSMKHEYYLYRVKGETYTELLNNGLSLSLRHDDIKSYRDICRADHLGSIET